MRPALGWIGALASVVVAFVLVGVIFAAVAPAPQGPALSSYATSTDGVAAYAELLARDGHRVSVLRTSLATARLPPDETLIVLPDGRPPLSRAVVRRLERFIRAGGWLVVSGLPAGQGGALGRGRAEAIPNAAFLENRRLADGDNAERGLALAGAASRPVVFDEAIHGYGQATGLAALPTRWWVGIALLGLAGCGWVLSRWRSLGGPDPLPPAAASPRVAYVTAMAATLARTREPSVLDELAREARERERTFERSLG